MQQYPVNIKKLILTGYIIDYKINIPILSYTERVIKNLEI